MCSVSYIYNREFETYSPLVLLNQVVKTNSWFVHKLQRFLSGANLDGACKCEKRLEVTHGSPSSRPRCLGYNREGVACRKRGQRGKKRRVLPIKKPPLSEGRTGIYFTMWEEIHVRSKAFFRPGCPSPLVVLCLFLANSQLQIVRALYCTGHFRCNWISPARAH